MKNEKKILSAIVVSLMLASCGDDKASDTTATTPTKKTVAQMNVVKLDSSLDATKTIDLLTADLSLGMTATFDVDTTDKSGEEMRKAYKAAYDAAVAKPTTGKIDASKPIILDLTGIKAKVIIAQTADKAPVLNVTKMTLDPTSVVEATGVAAVPEVKNADGTIKTEAVDATRLNVGAISTAKDAKFTLATAGELSLSSGTVNSVIELKHAAKFVFEDYADANAKLIGVNRNLVVGAHGVLQSETDAEISAGQTIVLNASGYDAAADKKVEIAKVATDAKADLDAKTKSVTDATAALAAAAAADKPAKQTLLDTANEALDAANAAVKAAQDAIKLAANQAVAGSLVFAASDTLKVMGTLQVDVQNTAAGTSLKDKKIVVGSVKSEAEKTVDAAGVAILNDGVWGDLTVDNGKATLSGKDTEAAAVKVGKGGTFTFDAKKVGNVDLAENATFVSTGKFDAAAGDFTLVAGKAHSFEATTGKTLTVGALTMNKFSKTKINISDAGMVTKGIDAAAFVTAYTPVFADMVARNVAEKAAADLKTATDADNAATTAATKATLKTATDADTAAKAAAKVTADALTADTNKLQAAYDTVKTAADAAAVVDGSTLMTSTSAMTVDGAVSLVAVNKKEIAAGSIVKIFHSGVKLTKGADLKVVGDVSIKLADASTMTDLTKATAVVLDNADKGLFLLTLAKIAAPAAAPSAPSFMGSIGGNVEQALLGNVSSFTTTNMGSVSIVSATEGQTGQFVGFNLGGFGVYASYETSTNALNSAAAAYNTSFAGFDFASHVTYAANKANLGDVNMDTKTFASKVAMGLPVKALGATFTPSAFAGYGVIASDNSTMVSGDSFNAGTSAGFAGVAFKAAKDLSFKSVAFKAFANFSAASEFAARGSENAAAPTQSSAMFGLNAAVDSSTSLSAQAGVVKNNNLDAQGKFELAMNIKL